jgi:hypothetical protein
MRKAALFGLALLSPTPVFAGDGCSYLTNEEVEQVLGRKLLFHLTSTPLPDGAGTMCDSNIVRVVVLTGANSSAALDRMIKDFGRAGEERNPLAELGDQAFALHLEPRKENDRPTALVAVSAKAATAAISVRAEDGQSAASAQPQAVALAKIVMSKLD